MKVIIEIEDTSEIDTALLNALHAVHNEDSFFVKAKNKMREDGIFGNDHFIVLEDFPSDTCKQCGCTEFLCGHNKR